MTKNQELEILQNTITTLGRDSYMGPWLKDNLQAIEETMRSDMPFLSFGEVQAWARERREQADRYAEQKIAAAERRAEEIIAEAQKQAGNKREYLRSQLRAILKEL